MATTKFHTNVTVFPVKGHVYTTYEMHDYEYGLEFHVDVDKHGYNITAQAWVCENLLASIVFTSDDAVKPFNPFRIALYNLACEVRMTCKSYDIDHLEPIMAEFVKFIEDNHLETILK